MLPLCLNCLSIITLAVHSKNNLYPMILIYFLLLSSSKVPVRLIVSHIYQYAGSWMDFNNPLLMSLCPSLLVSINPNLISYLAHFYLECTLLFYLYLYHLFAPFFLCLYYCVCLFVLCSTLKNVFHFLKPVH